MELPYTTGLMWTIFLVIFGANFGETYIPLMVLVLLGIHLGFALIPRRNGDTGRQHAEPRTEVQKGSSPAPDVHDRGDVDSGIGVGRDEIPRVRIGRT